MDTKTAEEIAHILRELRTITGGVKNTSGYEGKLRPLSRREMMQKARKAAKRVERLQAYLEGWLPTAAAAALTGYTSGYLRKLANQGRLQARKVGRDWQIQRESLQTYAEHMENLGSQRHNPWRTDLTAQGLGRQQHKKHDAED
jgi:excisionase family DNA binding protein